MRGRRNRFTLGLRGIGGAIDFEDFLGAFADARLEIEGCNAGKVIDHSLGDALAKDTQAVFLKKLRTDRCFRSGWKHRACSLHTVWGGLNIH